MKRVALWLPLAIFAVLLSMFALGIFEPADRTVVSKMIGKPVPTINLPAATDNLPGIAPGDYANGEPYLLNIFASWCPPCKAEAPHLETLQKRGARIYGVNIRDAREDVAKFLRENGNPYTRIGADDLSKVQFAIGSSGAPETFVVNGNGVIVHQHVGDVRASDVPKLLKWLEKAR